MHSHPLTICLLLAAVSWGSHVARADYPGTVESDNPVAFYRFEEANGTVAKDSARKPKRPQFGDQPASYHKVRLGAAGALAGKSEVGNKAARFDGKQSRILVSASPDVFDLTKALTIELWVRPVKGGEAKQVLVAKGDFVPNDGVTYYLVYFQNASDSGGQIRFGTFGSGHQYLDLVGEIPENQFTHLVVTFDTAVSEHNTRMYVNGRLNAQGTLSSKPASHAGQPLTIGVLSYDPAKQPYIQFFKGDLDEVAIYDHALNAERVLAHFNHAAPMPSFEQDVRPILAQHCHGCHGAEEQESQLDLRTVTAMLRGGENGPAIVRGRSGESLLVEQIRFGEMPPNRKNPLDSKQIALIERWIALGAPADEKVVEPPPRSLLADADRGHWAFQKLAKPTPPSVRHADRIRTAIDQFILAKLEQKGLSLSADVDRVRLARRAFFDLIGLPPSPEQVDRFLADQQPGAYERLVDSLLASPQFGVRWGRHWLDIVGYTDTISFDDDYNPPIGFLKGKWRYRDYVVRSFNQDKPYDRFVTEQLAGDELVDWRNAPKYTPEIIEPLVATGYFRTCEDISKEDPRPFIIWSVLHDTVEELGTSLMGLTLQCARCHSHKFEPIPQTDYYRIMALITPAFNPAAWKNPEQRALPDVSRADLAELKKHNGEVDKQVAELKKRIAGLRRAVELKLRGEKLSKVPEADRAATKAALDTPADKRSETQKALAAKYEKLVQVKPAEIDAALSQSDKDAIGQHNRRITELNASRRKHGWIQAVYDVGPPPATHLLKRGDYLTPRREVPAGFLGVLSDAESDSRFSFHEKAPIRGAKGDSNSGRRTAFARWLTDPRSRAGGLVARVMVNRVWQHLLGQGIVATSENLGRSGATPTHPQLLDWLAADFVEHDWRVKRLIKLIMTSSVYRQASGMRNAEFGVRNQPESIPHSAFPIPHSLLGRARLRRLEAEVIRDTILAISGKLDRTQGGPPVPLEYQPNGTITVAKKGLPTPTSHWRRSLYLLNRRIYNPSFLSVFDKPIVTSSVCRRDDSAVALQSLSMMNDALVLEHAEHFAKRVLSLAGDSRKRQIELAFRLAFARRPDATEVGWSRELLDQQTKLRGGGELSADQVSLKALANLCQTLFNTNEFLYVE